MTEAEILECNKLIAEFMGAVYDGRKYWTFPNGDTAIHSEGYDSQLKYHTSWDWLMPVGKKVRDILTEMHKTMPKHSANNGDLIEVDIMCRLYEYDIEKTWQHIVAFIQWYNNNQKQSHD